MVSVTQVLSVLNRYAGISPQVLQKAAHRGTLVHQHCLASLRGYHLPVPDEVRPYYDAFREWARLNLAEVIAVEAEVKDKTLGLVGHVDLICRLTRAPGRNCIVDLKRIAGKPDKAVGLQLAAYSHLSELTFRRRFLARYALHLKSDGHIHLIPFTDDRDWPVFLSAFSLFNHLKG